MAQAELKCCEVPLACDVCSLSQMSNRSRPSFVPHDRLLLQADVRKPPMPVYRKRDCI
jgi:hypothetical protein